MFFAGRRANIMIMVNIMINIMVYHWESLVWAEWLYKLNKWTKIGMKHLVFVNRKLASLLTRLLPHEMKPLLSCLNSGSCWIISVFLCLWHSKGTCLFIFPGNEVIAVCLNSLMKPSCFFCWVTFLNVHDMSQGTREIQSVLVSFNIWAYVP